MPRLRDVRLTDASDHESSWKLGRPRRLACHPAGWRSEGAELAVGNHCPFTLGCWWTRGLFIYICLRGVGGMPRIARGSHPAEARQVPTLRVSATWRVVASVPGVRRSSNTQPLGLTGWTEPKNSDSAESGALRHKRSFGREPESAIRGVKKKFQNLADWPVTAGRVRR